MNEAPPPPLHMRRAGFGPDPALTQVRDQEGVCRVAASPDLAFWLVTRYRDVRRVLDDPQRFSNSHGQLLHLDETSLSEEQRAVMRAGNLLAFDPPDHTRLRRMLAPAFSSGRMRRLRPRIQAIVDDRLDALEREGPPADLVADFAVPIPSLVIGELLGVPPDDRDELQQRTARTMDAGLPAEEHLALQGETRRYMARLVARAREHPGDDLLGALVRRHGDDLTDEELTGMACLLLTAGHETTANMLGVAVLALLRHPDQLRMLRDRPEQADAAVEELLRWLSVAHNPAPRMTTGATEIAGRAVGPGELVLCSLSAANRDSALTADPERLDLSRGDPAHLAFGHGPHHCLGAPLARMELHTALPALFDRFPRLHTTEPGPAFRAGQLVHGLTRLPVGW
ncbi:cytochrome P450 [Streptomyces capparidis]